MKKLDKYHLIVILLYLTILPFLLYFFNDRLHYGVSKNISLVFVVLIFSLIFIIFSFKRNYFKVTIFIISYALFFAFAEEIIFRGIIQNIIQSYTKNFLLIIFFSSSIFGIAHLFNSTSSFYPKDWNWKLAGLTFLVGIPLGILFIITDSLFLPTILHATLLIYVYVQISNKNI